MSKMRVPRSGIAGLSGSLREYPINPKSVGSPLAATLHRDTRYHLQIRPPLYDRNALLCSADLGRKAPNETREKNDATNQQF